MKPTQEQILKALNKLVRENKTELKAEKIELGAYSDVVAEMKNAKNLTNLEGEISDLFNKITARARTLVSFSGQVKKDLSSSLQKLENGAKELGVKPNTIDIYKDAQSLLKSSEDKEKLFKQMLAAVQKFG